MSETTGVPQVLSDIKREANVEMLLAITYFFEVVVSYSVTLLVLIITICRFMQKPSKFGLRCIVFSSYVFNFLQYFSSPIFLFYYKVGFIIVLLHFLIHIINIL